MTTPPSAADGPKWKRLFAVLGVWALLLIIIRLFLSWDNAVLFLATASACVMMGTLCLVWLLRSSGLPRGVRRGLGLLVALAAVGLLTVYRVDGWTGDMQPIFGPRFELVRPDGRGWPQVRWLGKKDQALAATRRPAIDGQAAPVDLHTTTPHDVPQFLGPQRDCVSPTATVASDWQMPPELVWKHPCGGGWSAFAVVGDYAVTMEQLGPNETTVCYEVATGATRWSHADPVRFVSALGGDGPRATPTIYAGRVYTYGGTGILNCLDGATGRRLWSRNPVVESGVQPPAQADHAAREEATPADGRFPLWGKSCSPLIHDNRVIVSAGGDEGRSLAAYDAESGELVWQAGDGVSSYASPVLMRLAGREQIVMLNGQSVAGHDAVNGQLLWEHPWPGAEPKVPNPVQVADNRLVALAGYGLGCKLLEVSVDETGAWSVAELWHSRNLKPKFTNAVLHGGMLYAIDDGRGIVCLDPRTGDRRWRGGRYGHGQIVLSGELLIVQAESGDVAIVAAAADAHRELARFPALTTKTWNNPVLAGEYLLVRNDQQAACFRVAGTTQ